MPVDFTETRIPYLRDEQIRRRADDFRTQYWGNKIPVDVELIAERAFNLLIIPVPDLERQTDAEAFLSGDLRELLYDQDSPEVRVRFSIAHEIGHIVLHKDVLAKLRPSSVDEWRELQRTMPDATWGRAEYQAREFAGRLLVPVNKLIEALRNLQPQIAKAMEISPDLELPVLRDLVSPKIAKMFFVSDEVIKRRLELEGISPMQQ
ncbi:MAG: ImmA/IrrE family metallo-endopeptidase [Ignavibacteria bacterium]|nr:ImmA/IrrE family metallo-endopeptidase [Ignavibacteria bacterium]